MWNYARSLKNKLTLLIFFTAIIISILLTAFLSSLYYYSGVERLFSEQVKKSMEEAGNVAKLYLDEHINSIRVDSLVIQGKIERSPDILDRPADLKAIFDEFADNRMLSEIVLFRESRQNIAHSSHSLSFLFDSVPEESLQKADGGQIYVYRKGSDKVQAVSRIYTMHSEKVYLLVGRYLDQDIMKKIRDSKNSTNIYATAEKKLRLLKKPIIIIFTIGYVIFFLFILLIAKRISHLIVVPLQNLANTASRIKDGEYGLIVPETQTELEIAALSAAFNKMSAAIAHRQSELELAKNMLNQRNHFIELVLEEITAGVVVLNSKQNIILLNNAAKRILRCPVNSDKQQQQQQQNYEDYFPELKPFLEEITINNDDLPICQPPLPSSSPSNHSEQQNIIIRKAFVIRNAERVEILLHMRLIPHSDHNIIITFDDITELSEAERLRAWADVAQKVTHEIKNPLTPIQLSVERLEKKFLPTADEARKQFLRYTEIILERVSDIKFLIKEFTTFSRIAPPKLEKSNIIELLNNIIFLERNAYRHIQYKFDNEDTTCYVSCDRMQINQVLTNLFKNAAESINMRLQNDPALSGIITVSLANNQDLGSVVIAVEDNGLGFKTQPVEGISSKADGAGIGLAIVRKILHSHVGSNFEIRSVTEGGGASASFSLKKHDDHV